MTVFTDFEHEFMKRTLALVQQYSEQYDATLLLNCMLGLLIVPNEKFIDEIPTDHLSDLHDWGITTVSINDFGVPTKTNPQPETLRGVIWSLRNAVAHFRVEPTEEQGQVQGFRFKDLTGFDATIRLSELKTFVERLSKHLDNS